MLEIHLRNNFRRFEHVQITQNPKDFEHFKKDLGK